MASRALKLGIVCVCLSLLVFDIMEELDWSKDNYDVTWKSISDMFYLKSSFDH